MKFKNLLTDIAIVVLLAILVSIFIAVILLKILFQNIAAKEFSFEEMFGRENVAEALLLYFVVLIVIAPLYFFHGNK